jgi:hypothetical protein
MATAKATPAKPLRINLRDLVRFTTFTEGGKKSVDIAQGGEFARVMLERMATSYTDAEILETMKHVRATVRKRQLASERRTSLKGNA